MLRAQLDQLSHASPLLCGNLDWTSYLPAAGSFCGCCGGSVQHARILQTKPNAEWGACAAEGWAAGSFSSLRNSTVVGPIPFAWGGMYLVSVPLHGQRSEVRARAQLTGRAPLTARMPKRGCGCCGTLHSLDAALGPIGGELISPRVTDQAGACRSMARQLGTCAPAAGRPLRLLWHAGRGRAGAGAGAWAGAALRADAVCGGPRPRRARRSDAQHHGGRPRPRPQPEPGRGARRRGACRGRTQVLRSAGQRSGAEKKKGASLSPEAPSSARARMPHASGCPVFRPASAKRPLEWR